MAPRSIVLSEAAYLSGLRDDLKARRFAPLPVREQLIPKNRFVGSASRLLGIAASRPA